MRRVLEQTGLVFNIQRFSIHDGPGIRTTVFVKGCSLRCFWCHNPEGLESKIEIQFSPSKCIGCGACIEVCAHGGHVFVDGAHVYVRENCRLCGQCVEECFAGALELTGKRMSVDEVMQEVLADRPFYETSGGGVTLSGGEPMMQELFTRAILQRCKAEGLHTAVETSANYGWKRLEALLPWIDLFMIDLKHLNSDAHRAATGVPNERILDNAERLMHTARPVWFRTPVVPTVNDTPEEIAEIAAFVRRLTDVRLQSKGANADLPLLELLRFHRLAADKYRGLGMEYKARELEPPSREQMAELARVAQSYGIRIKNGWENEG